MTLRRALQSLAFALVASCVAASAGAQENVTIQFSEGRVTLSAQSVSLSRILEEWARVGGTRILKVTDLAGPPVTIQLTGVPEPQALSVPSKESPDTSCPGGQRRSLAHRLSSRF